MKSEIIRKLIKTCGKKHVMTENWSKETYCKGWRYGSGHAIAVVKPGTLLEIWKVLNVCNDSNLIIIMQAANTGLTGGSTPYGEDYDRDIVIINTMRINDIHLLLEDVIKVYNHYNLNSEKNNIDLKRNNLFLGKEFDYDYSVIDLIFLKGPESGYFIRNFKEKN